MFQGFITGLFSWDITSCFRLAVMNGLNGQKAINFLKMRRSFSLAFKNLANRDN